MQYKYGIIGAFDFNEEHTGGQSVKTREFFYALKNRIGEKSILFLETSEWKRQPIEFVLKMLRIFCSCSEIIVFPAQHGVRIFAPIFSILRKVHNNKLHYSVIGGWLPEMIKKRKGLSHALKQFNTILVETTVMQKSLEAQGFKNVYVLENFKSLTPIDTAEINDTDPSQIRICFFSRVIREKGIEDAVQAVKRINENTGSVLCIFDIYGPVIDEYREDFDILCSTFTNRIHYCGKIQPSGSISTLKNYDLQVFPTQFLTEGIPGSIIDSYFAGVPVIASKWNSFGDVIDEGITGIGYEFNNADDLYQKLLALVHEPDKINWMKRNCLQKAKQYSPDVLLDKFFRITSAR